MSDTVKKGVLEVKKRNLFGSAYKQKYVILRNSASLKCKMVEIQDTEDTDDLGDIVKLTDLWRVQDRPSKNRGRYAFELIMGDEAILTFSCSSVVEREEWTEAFRVLNQLALPLDAAEQAAMPLTDYFSVNLLKNRSALEIGHSGQYLLSINGTAIVLHWRTGAIAHHWPRRSVTKLFHPGKEGHLLLHANRVGSAGPPMEFEFVTANDSAMQILKLWNIRLLESIPCNAQQLNEISNFLNTGSEEPKKKGSRRSKSHRSSESGSIQRASSFSKSHTLSTGATLSQGGNFGPPLPALPVSRDQQVRSWGGPNDHHNSSAGILSQDSFFSSTRLVTLGSARMSTSPPPLPPRPEESSSDEEDPDYAYIDENKVKGPQVNGGSHLPPKRSVSPSLDDQLEELKKDIMREKKAKKKKAVEQKRSEYPQYHLHSTLGIQRQTSPRSRPFFPPADPEDYLEPVPSKRIQSTSTSSNGSTSSFLNSGQHSRSVSEPDSTIAPSPPKTLSQPPIFELGGEGELGLLQPTHQSRHDSSPSDLSPVQGGANPPALPPRTWRNSSVTSTSSINSASSIGGSAFSFNSRTASVPEMPFREEDEVVSKRTYGVNENSSTFSQRTDSHREENHSRTSPDMNTPTNPLPLPPRSPNKSHRLSSSSASPGSPATICPRCHSLRKSKTSVAKTFSLDHKTVPPLPNEENRKSLPNLNAACAFPENDLRNRKPSHGRPPHQHHLHHQRHTCGKHSPDASSDMFPNRSNPSLQSSQNMEYLELVGDSPPPSSIETELRPEIDLLQGCLQALEYLEHKVNRGDSITSASTTSTQQTTSQAGAQSSEHKKIIQTDLDAAIQQTQQVQADLSENLRKSTAVVPPLLKRNTIATISTAVQSPTSSSMVSRSLSTTTTTTRANGTLPHRSSSSMASINSSPGSPPPPVPPRSIVSLGGPPEQTLPKSPKLSRRSNTFSQVPPNHYNRHTLAKTRSLSRQGTYGATIYGNAQIPGPPRSSSVAGTASGLSDTSIASRYNNHHRHFNTHMDSQSQTVFVHHIKGRHLAHMV